MFQKVGDKKIKRSEHVWYQKKDKTWKCVFCGAISENTPEKFEFDWLPERYEPLTDLERKLCSYQS